MNIDIKELQARVKLWFTVGVLWVLFYTGLYLSDITTFQVILEKLTSQITSIGQVVFFYALIGLLIPIFGIFGFYKPWIGIQLASATLVMFCIMLGLTCSILLFALFFTDSLSESIWMLLISLLLLLLYIIGTSKLLMKFSKEYNSLRK